MRWDLQSWLAGLSCWDRAILLIKSLLLQRTCGQRPNGSPLLPLCQLQAWLARTQLPTIKKKKRGLPNLEWWTYKTMSQKLLHLCSTSSLLQAPHCSNKMPTTACRLFLASEIVVPLKNQMWPQGLLQGSLTVTASSSAQINKGSEQGRGNEQDCNRIQ